VPGHNEQISKLHVADCLLMPRTANVMPVDCDRAIGDVIRKTDGNRREKVVGRFAIARAKPNPYSAPGPAQNVGFIGDRAVCCACL
jgi:hypothetical protein